MFNNESLRFAITAAAISIIILETNALKNGKKISNFGESNSDFSKKKSDDDNYIITHYGTERYTPVSEDNIQMFKNGFFKSEVIPVDPNTGLEISGSNGWKPMDTMFVPLHTGYSIDLSQNSNLADIKVAPTLDDNFSKLTEINNPEFMTDIKNIKPPNQDFSFVNVSSNINFEKPRSKNKRKKYASKQFGFTSSNKPAKENLYYDVKKIAENSQNKQKNSPKRHVVEIPLFRQSENSNLEKEMFTRSRRLFHPFDTSGWNPSNSYV